MEVPLCILNFMEDRAQVRDEHRAILQHIQPEVEVGRNCRVDGSASSTLHMAEERIFRR
jgi:hypothetical protein